VLLREGEKIVARADVFSLGAVLYTMLAGHAWDREVGACVQEDEELDRELKDILLTAVDRDRGRRYPSVQAFHSALAAYLEHIWPGRAW
jgi:serine/threonine protein kinase